MKCASDTTIAKFMKNKYIVTLENSKKFVPHKFESERILESAEIKWYALNALTRNDYVNMITRTSMQLKDSWYDTGSEEAETGFYKEVTPKRDMPYDEPFQNAITFEMTLDQKEYFR